MQAPALPCSSSAVTSCQRSLLLTSAQLNSARKRMQRYKLPGQRQNNKETFFRKRRRFSQFLTNRRTEEGHTLIIYYKDRQQKHKNWKGKTDRKDGKDGITVRTQKHIRLGRIVKIERLNHEHVNRIVNDLYTVNKRNYNKTIAMKHY